MIASCSGKLILHSYVYAFGSDHERLNPAIRARDYSCRVTSLECKSSTVSTFGTQTELSEAYITVSFFY